MNGNQVLLTGAAGGLGLEVLRVLLAQGAKVTAVDHSSESSERIKKALTSDELINVQLITANLLDEQAIIQLISSMERIDALIHTVGGFSMGKTHEYSFAAWKKDLDLNLNTTFLVCKHSLGKMLEQNYGRIVTVGSRGAVQPGGQLAAYSAAKAGVVALTQAIADETKGTNITANVVLPSVIDTPTNRKAMGAENADQWVKPESLAAVICFLASAAAQDIRGGAVPVYGNS